MTPDLIYDQLIGMNCCRKLICSWGGNPGVGSLHRFREAIENEQTPPPTTTELEVLRKLHARTARAHEGAH